jgi:Abnormal spindle-like microcephaly-assoc'd, ASPM-SPD-2-Hydin
VTLGHRQLSQCLKTIGLHRGAFLSLFIASLAAFPLSGCVGVADKTASPAAPKLHPGAQAQLAVTPSAITFQNVVVGQKNTQTIQVSNTGNAELDISAISLTGTGFSLGSVTAPLQLAPSASKNFTVSFTPATVTTSAKATITISSNDANSTFTVPVNGTSVKPTVSWELNPASIAFPSITVQGTKSQSVTVTSTGNSPVTIGSMAITGAAFSMSGVNAGTTLAEGQQLTFQVTFHPLATGNLAGSLKLTSSSGAVLNMSISGTATAASTLAATPHSVTLSWNPSSGGSIVGGSGGSIVGGIVGYRIYRGTSSGGPYSGLNSSVDSSTSYVDSSVVSGGRYFYVATAVDSTGNESAYSNEASATIPNP